MNPIIYEYNKIKAKQFENVESMEKYFEKHNKKDKNRLKEKNIKKNNKKDKKRLIAGVVFESDDYLNYTIRVSGEIVPDPKSNPIGNYMESIANEIIEKADTEDIRQIKESEKNYNVNFIRLQNYVDNAILQLKLNNTELKYEIDFNDLAKPAIFAYIANESADRISAISIALIFAIEIVIIALSIVGEKNKKEGLLMIGVHSSTIWISHEIMYIVVVPFISLITSIILALRSSINFILVFLLLLAFGLSCSGIAVLITTFFKKVKNLLLFLGLFIFSIIIILSGLFEITSTAINGYIIMKKIVAALLSPISMGLAINDILEARYNKMDVNLINMFERDTGLYFIFIVVSVIIYHGLAYLLDIALDTNVTLFNPKKSIPKSELKANENSNSNNTNTNSDIQEDFDENENCSKCVVEVKNLYKVYKSTISTKNKLLRKEKFCVLNNVSFKVYKNEIFGILGNNGAGKTTLIQTMIGLLNSDSGKILYEGIDYTDNQKAISKDFGICSQDDIYYENLSIEDNIKIFAGLKGVEVNIEEILNDIDLTEKRLLKVKKLSGGQKSKLKIGLATIANPKYIFLDEPTNGLDPFSKRKIWNYLMKKKENSTIFLITHAMDEADILTDRKLIMKNGKIRCLGTSLFLKKKLKVKYSLDVETESQEKVHEIITKYIPEAEYVEKNIKNVNDIQNKYYFSQMNCYTWKLPLIMSANFMKLLEELEMNTKISCNNENDDCVTDCSENKDKIINKFSLSMPSLEELFINLDNDNKNNENNIDNNNKKNGDNSNEEDSNALLSKNSNVININGYNEFNELPVLKPVKKPGHIKKISCMIKYRMKLYSKSILYLILLIALEMFIILFGLRKYGVASKEEINLSYEKVELNPFKMYKNTKLNYYVQYENNLVEDTSNNKYLEKLIPPLNNNKSSIDNKNIDKFDSDIENNKVDYYYFASVLEKQHADDGIEDEDDKDDEYYYEYKTPDYDFTISDNSSMPHARPITLNTLTNMVLSINNISDHVTVNSHPFSYTQEKINNIDPIFINLIFSICLILGIIFIGPMVVYDKVENLLRQFQLNGITSYDYWVSVFTSDFILYIIYCIIILSCGIIIKLEMLRESVFIMIISVSVIFWAIASLMFQYFISFFYKKRNSIEKNFILINIVPSVIIMLFRYMQKGFLVTFTTIETCDVGMNPFMMIEGVVTILYPMSGISNIINVIFCMCHKNKIGEFDITLSSILNLRNEILLFDLALIASAIIYGIGLRIKDKSINNISSKKAIVQRSKENIEKNNEILKNGDVDVYNEFKRVCGFDINNNNSNNDDNNNNSDNNESTSTLSTSSEIPIKFIRVGKEYEANDYISSYDDIVNGIKNKNPKFGEIHPTVYGNNVLVVSAIEDVSFGINKKECFGLLGPNGAGKSTLLKTVTYCIPQTVGDIMYNGVKSYNINKNDIMEGYCPQNDTLWKEFTLFEHMVMILNLKGYSTSDSKKYASQYIKCGKLEKHKNKRPSQLSNGMKRRLNLLMALCGDPPKVMLDEPTTGMDPINRRIAWNMIKKSNQNSNSSIILTTHSMEEAECLCNRIGILINGRLQCIGSPEHIKLKYGNKYILEIHSNDIDTFHTGFSNELNDLGLKYNLEKQINNNAKYEIDVSTSIGKVFSILEKYKTEKLLIDYSFSHISLEEIFLKFAKINENNEI